jgi:hypothetical protein
MNDATHDPGDGQVRSPVAMWVEAWNTDLFLQRMKNDAIDFSQVRAVSEADQILPLQCTL